MKTQLCIHFTTLFATLNVLKERVFGQCICDFNCILALSVLLSESGGTLVPGIDAETAPAGVFQFSQ